MAKRVAQILLMFFLESSLSVAGKYSFGHDSHTWFNSAVLARRLQYGLKQAKDNSAVRLVLFCFTRQNVIMNSFSLSHQRKTCIGMKKG